MSDIEEYDREAPTSPPPNTYTVSHILNHRPSLLTLPHIQPVSTQSERVDPAAFDYLTAWVGYKGEDTWEPRASFWDEWKVGEYWKERRVKVAERNGWGVKEAEDEEWEEKLRVCKKWREYWADKMDKQRRKRRRSGGAGGGSDGQRRRQMRGKVEEAKESATDRVEEELMREEKEEATDVGGGEQLAQAGDGDTDSDEPAVKRRAGGRRRTSARRSGSRKQPATKRARDESKEEANDEKQQEASGKVETATAQQAVPEAVAAASSAVAHVIEPHPSPASPPQPAPATRVASPLLRSAPPSPPSPPMASLSSTTAFSSTLLSRGESVSVHRSTSRLHSPPPIEPPPSPPPRRTSLHRPSSLASLAVTVPPPPLHLLHTQHSTLSAPPRHSSSTIASDDDTIPTSSQPDDDDLALTPVAVTVSSSLSFDRGVMSSGGESDREELRDGRRRVRFCQLPVRILQLKVWEEDGDDTEERKKEVPFERVEQRIVEEEEREEENDSADERPLMLIRRPLLPQKDREFLDRLSQQGRAVKVTRSPDDSRGRAEQNKTRVRRRGKLLSDIKQQHDEEMETEETETLTNDAKREAETVLNVGVKTGSERLVKDENDDAVMALADERTAAAVARESLSPRKEETMQAQQISVASAPSVAANNEPVVARSLSHDSETSTAVATTTDSSTAENDEDDQPIARLNHKPPSASPSIKQQQSAASTSTPPNTNAPTSTHSLRPRTDTNATAYTTPSHLTTEEDDHSADDSADDDDNPEGQFTVESILDRRRKRGKTEYLIHWLGYTADSDSWEPEDNLSCDKLLEAFEAEWQKRSGRSKGRSRRGREVDTDMYVEQQARNLVEEERAEQGSKSLESEPGSAMKLESQASEAVSGQEGADAEVTTAESLSDSDDKKRTSPDTTRRRASAELLRKADTRSDHLHRNTTAARRTSAPASSTAMRRVSEGKDGKNKPVEMKSVAECSVDELEYIARTKRREEMRVAKREHHERKILEMVAAKQASTGARPVRSMSGGGTSEAAGERSVAMRRPGLLKRSNGSAVGGDRAGSRDSVGKVNGPLHRTNGVIPRIPKMSHTGLYRNGSSSFSSTTSASSGCTSPPPSNMLRSPPVSPQLLPLSNDSSPPSISALSSLSSPSLVAQLGAINDALSSVPPASQRSSSLPSSAPATSSSVTSSSPSLLGRSTSASTSASDIQPSLIATTCNVLLMGDAALAFALVLLDHRPTTPTTLTSTLHPPSLTCASTPFLSLLSTHPRVYCVPASPELTTLLPLSLTCDHLKSKRLFLRQDVDALALADSFHALRFGCVQVSVGGEGDDTAGEVALMAQVMRSVAAVMCDDGVLRWTVPAQHSTGDNKRSEDNMRQRGTAAGLQLVSVERTYLGVAQPTSGGLSAEEGAEDGGVVVNVKADRERVRQELTTFMGGETYIFTRIAPPPPAAPQPTAFTPPSDERTTEQRRNGVLEKLRREHKERELAQRDARARDKFAALAQHPSSDSSAALLTSHLYHRAPLPQHVTHFDADKARFSAQAFMQHRLGGGASGGQGGGGIGRGYTNGQSHGSTFVR